MFMFTLVSLMLALEVQLISSHEIQVKDWPAVKPASRVSTVPNYSQGLHHAQCTVLWHGLVL